MPELDGIDLGRYLTELNPYMENKAESKYRYNGDYMNQYSWSEYYLAELDEISYSFD